MTEFQVSNKKELKTVKYFIKKKIPTEKIWKGNVVYVSGSVHSSRFLRFKITMNHLTYHKEKYPKKVESPFAKKTKLNKDSVLHFDRIHTRANLQIINKKGL